MKLIQRLLDAWDLTGERTLEKVFAGRKPLTSEEFFETYFANKGYPRDVVVRVKEIFDANVMFDLSRLAAEDDFSKELNFIWNHDSLGDVKVVLALEEAFAIKFADDEARHMSTLNLIVETVCQKIAARAEPKS